MGLNNSNNLSGSDSIFNFQIKKFESIGSTSLFIKDLFNDSNKEVVKSSEYLCVQSNTQNQGRGTHGNSWFSPYGNIYVSFGIKELRSNNLKISPYLPLEVAKIVHSFLHTHFGINCYVKWPNDIYFNCSKLCGILCESMIQKDYICVVIGIGINLISSKKLDSKSYSSFKVPPIGIEDIMDHDINSSKTIDDFISYFSSNLKYGFVFDSKSESESDLDSTSTSVSQIEQVEKYILSSNFQDLIYPRSYPHLDLSSNTLVYDIQYDPLVQNSSLPLYSKDCGFVGVDIGNSKAKLFFIPDGSSSCSDYYEFLMNLDLESDSDSDSNSDSSFELKNQGINQALRDLSQKLLDSFSKSNIKLQYKTDLPIFIMSVSSKHLDQFKRLASKYFRPIDLIKRSCRVDYRYPTLGIDRACLLEAVCKLYPNKSSLIVSFGTACTIDFLETNHHLGGFILSGIYSRFSSLARCANLNQIYKGFGSFIKSSPKDITKLVGTSTNEGIYGALILEIVSLFKNITSLYPSFSNLILTGGDAPFVLEILTKYLPTLTPVYLKDLSAQGIKIMVKGG